mmetsp:Transcript_4379/g.9116  ORF Transcript_4379/g.9116 Transcript_4379/m.9116 type:complete len:94 (+) Transcript_4379:95-376(+)
MFASSTSNQPVLSGERLATRVIALLLLVGAAVFTAMVPASQQNVQFSAAEFGTTPVTMGSDVSMGAAGIMAAIGVVGLAIYADLSRGVSTVRD